MIRPRVAMIEGGGEDDRRNAVGDGPVEAPRRRGASRQVEVNDGDCIGAGGGDDERAQLPERVAGGDGEARLRLEELSERQRKGARILDDEDPARVGGRIGTGLDHGDSVHGPRFDPIFV